MDKHLNHKAKARRMVPGLTRGYSTLSGQQVTACLTKPQTALYREAVLHNDMDNVSWFYHSSEEAALTQR